MCPVGFKKSLHTWAHYMYSGTLFLMSEYEITVHSISACLACVLNENVCVQIICYEHWGIFLVLFLHITDFVDVLFGHLRYLCGCFFVICAGVFFVSVLVFFSPHKLVKTVPEVNESTWDFLTLLTEMESSTSF